MRPVNAETDMVIGSQRTMMLTVGERVYSPIIPITIFLAGLSAQAPVEKHKTLAPLIKRDMAQVGGSISETTRLSLVEFEVGDEVFLRELSEVAARISSNQIELTSLERAILNRNAWDWYE